MVKFENLWLFERSKFQRFSNFIIAQCLVEIRTKPDCHIIRIEEKIRQIIHDSILLKPFPDNAVKLFVNNL